MIVETFKVNLNEKAVHNKHLLSEAERHCKFDNFVTCHRKVISETL